MEILNNKTNKNNSTTNAGNNDVEKEIILTQSLFDAILDDEELVFEDDYCLDNFDLDSVINSDIIEMAGLRYIFGFTAYHFKAKYPYLSQTNDPLKATTDCPDWITTNASKVI